MAVLIALILLGGAFAAWLCKGIIIYWLEVAVAVAAGKRGKKNPWLEGNYAPVKEELLEADLPVEGKLPAALDGAYVRNGPNPSQHPIGGHHWFDGDGMLHAVRIKDGKAAYSNAYVQTAKYKQEKKAGRPLFFTMGAMEGMPGVLIYMLQQLKKKLGIVQTKDGHGPMNTSVVFHNKQLMALVETDFPQVVRVNNDARIETLERQTYGGQLQSPFTAHPKTDPVTGELHGIGYSFGSKPWMHYYVIGSGGTVKLDVDIPLIDPVMMHDFAITEDYAVFLDFPLTIKPENLSKGEPLVSFNPARVSRFGVLPKHAHDAGKIRWFELPAMFAFHVANAWQEGNAIRLFACMYTEGFEFANVAAGNQSLPKLTEVRLDLDSGKASVHTASNVLCEFPTVPDSLVGRKTRYTYVVMYDFVDGLEVAHGIAKLDLAASSSAAAAAGKISFGSGRIGGEAVFIPASTDPAALKSEDDGYLATFVYDEATHSSEFMVYDARSFSAEPVARVKLPQRVPQGFHGRHINAAQFQAQFPFDIHFLPDI